MHNLWLFKMRVIVFKWINMEINLKIKLTDLNIKSGCSREANRTGRGHSATISVVLDFAVVYRRCVAGAAIGPPRFCSLGAGCGACYS